MRYDDAHIKALKRLYPEGTRILLKEMHDSYPVPSGTKGSVHGIDDMGQIQMHWDNGSSLALICNYDEFEIINDKMERR